MPDHVNVKVSAGGQNFQGKKDLKTIITEMEVKMQDAAANLEFEGQQIANEIRRLEATELGLDAHKHACLCNAHHLQKSRD